MTADLTTAPWVPVEGIPNFRDLGGWPVRVKDDLQKTNGPRFSFRTGFVYRCGEPSRITQDGIKAATLRKITHAYDLRAGSEIERKGVGIVEWEGCQRIFCPVFTDVDYSPQNLAIRFKNYSAEGTDGFVAAYTDILESAPSSYRQILLHIANMPNDPLIIHCTAGKDRTGVICAMILSLCGVDDETVAYEYSLTEFGLAEWKEQAVQEMMANPLLNFDKTGALNMFSARASNMLATLKMIHERYGGAEGYILNQCGLTKENIESIKSNLIVQEEPVHMIKNRL